MNVKKKSKKELKENRILTVGTVIKRIPNNEFRIELENGMTVRGYIPARWRVARANSKRKGRPNLVQGDKVKVEVITGGTQIEIGEIVAFAK